jgi:hypothetical protein
MGVGAKKTGKNTDKNVCATVRDVFPLTQAFLGIHAVGGNNNPVIRSIMDLTLALEIGLFQFSRHYCSPNPEFIPRNAGVKLRIGLCYWK